MEGGSGGSFSLDSHFISQSGDNSIDTSIRVTNTSIADLAFSGGANSEGATVYYLPSGHIPRREAEIISFGSDVTSSSFADCDKVNYSVKVISPHTPEGVQLKKWETQIEKFSDLEAIKWDCQSISMITYEIVTKFGYIQHGHGSKGRQVPLDEPKDIEAMYEAYRGRKKVILWVKVYMWQQRNNVALALKVQ